MSARFALDQLPAQLRAQAEQRISEQKRKKKAHGSAVAATGRRRRPGPGKSLVATPKAVATLRLQMRADGLIGWQEEYRFHPTRGWRFDFALVPAKLAVEVEGLTFKGGRHQRFHGYTEDCTKYSEAVALGWRLIRVTPAMVRRGEAIAYIKRALEMT